MRSGAETTSYRLPQISRISTDFFDLCGLGMKGTQMAQMTQILTCPVWDFTDDSYSSDFAEESDEKICGNP